MGRIAVPLALLLALSGCNKEASNNTSSRTTKTQAESREAAIAAWTPHPEIQEAWREHEWNREQIERHHRTLFMTDLPAYVETIRGIGNPGLSESTNAMWGGVVPMEHIADFREYIRSLGVPEEFMDKNSGAIGVRRGKGWAPPDPPSRSLEFRRSSLGTGGGSYLGLSFEPGTSMNYVLENPNVPNSFMKVKFSQSTGALVIYEILIDI